MLKGKINDRVTNKEYNVEFLNKSTKGQKVINFVYSTNGKGKSTLCNILDGHFNNYDNVNIYTGDKSTFVLGEGSGTYSKSFKFDNEFFDESVSNFKGSLIIAPKNAKEIADTIKLVESLGDKVIKEVLKNDFIKDGVFFNNADKLKGVLINSLTVKTVNKNHKKLLLETLYKRYCSDEYIKLHSKDVERDALPVVKLVDKINFLKFEDVLKPILDAGDKLQDLISSGIPNISIMSYEMKKQILSYLSNDEYNITSNICEMCGVTEMSEEVVSTRIDTLREEIEKYRESTGDNIIQKAVNFFKDNKPNQGFMLDVYNMLMTLDKTNSNEIILGVQEVLQKRNLHCELDLKNFIYDHLIEEVETDFNKYKELNSKLDFLKEASSNDLDNETVELFKHNLEKMNFEGFNEVEITNTNGFIEMKLRNKDIIDVFENALSQSEKTIIVLSLFLAVIEHGENMIILIDDPVDSNDSRRKIFVYSTILSQVVKSDALIVFTSHDLQFARLINDNVFEDRPKMNNMILENCGIRKLNDCSIIMNGIEDYVFKVIIDKDCKYDTHNLWSKPFIVGILTRYLSKNQAKFYNEPILNPNILDIKTNTRKFSKAKGYDGVTDSFFHYLSRIDILEFYDDMKVVFKGYDNFSIDTNVVLRNEMDSVELLEILFNSIKDYEVLHEMKGILLSLKIRVMFEKGFCEKYSCDRYKIKKLISKIDDRNIVDFHLKQRPILNSYAHLENDVNILLNYELSDLLKIENKLKDLF